MQRIFYSTFTEPIKRIGVLFAALLFLSLSSRAQYSMFNGFDPSLDVDYDYGDANVDTANTPGLDGIVVGVKFQVGQAGTISSISVWSEGSSQTYTAHLWSLTTHTSLTGGVAVLAPGSGGWQTVPVTPYHVVPNVNYVASVFIDFGNYNYIYSSMPTSDFVVPALPPYALILIGTSASAAAPANPGNGVYGFETAVEGDDTYPRNLSPSGSNYLVDVSFTPDFLLPVSLLDFKANTDNKNVDLTWKTASEDNNKGFEIQRSNNNTDWYTIGFVNGRGQSNSTQSYTFTDNQLAPGKYFYRLNQVDIDNHTRASSIVTASLSGKGKLLLFQNTPNPIRAGLTTLIRYDLPDAQKARLSVLDITGREVKVLARHGRTSRFASGKL